MIKKIILFLKLVNCLLRENEKFIDGLVVIKPCFNWSIFCRRYQHVSKRKNLDSKLKMGLIDFIFNSLLFIIKILKLNKNIKYNWICHYNGVTSDGIFEIACVDGFMADPFFINNQFGLVKMVEVYSNKINRGDIKIFFKDDEFILEDGEHLSFPYPIDFNGSLLKIIPETSSQRAIILYEIDVVKKILRNKKTLIDKINAVDTIHFYFKGDMYLLTSIDEIGTGDYDSCLGIFKSNLTDNKYEESFRYYGDGNDLPMRNGGFYERNGNIYRVRQLSSPLEYGKGIEVMRIVDLIPYTEVRDIDAELNLKGLLKSFNRVHHLYGYEDSIAYDVRSS
jgi:hypothetical protein